MQQNDFDVRAARERLGLTPEALAATLHVTEGEVRGWEDGSIRPRRDTCRQLEYLAARAEWDAGMAASGLPACEWLEPRLLRLEHGAGDRAWIALRNEVTGHLAACETCRAREAWAREHLPPAPTPPLAGLYRLALAADAGIDGLPEWARPAAYGAIALALLTSVRVLFLIPSMLRSPASTLAAALGTVLLAAAAGAAGGLAYSLTRPWPARLGWIGGYLSGIVCVAAYLGAFGVIALFTFGIPERGDLVVMLVIGVFCSVLFGTLLGKFINDVRSDRPAQG